VLHFRQSIEHQQQLRLLAANQQVARVQHLVEQMDARRQQLHAMQIKQLSSGMTAAELRFGLLCEAEILRHRRELEQQHVRLQQLREQQREIFHQARRARETLEALRDRQFRLYQKEAARREQRSLDDLFLLRRQYLRRG
jgi:flagellar export protein FliJ